MIALEQVRSALLAPQPWSELDKLVRVEQAAGRRVKEIQTELEAMILPVRETPGLPEDGDDPLLDTLDALAGWCHPKCRYTDPPNLSSPNATEIAALPNWARVAYAARCARRLFSLYSKYWGKDEQYKREANILAFVEAAATNGDLPAPLNYVGYGIGFAGMHPLAAISARAIGIAYLTTVNSNNVTVLSDQLSYGIVFDLSETINIAPYFRHDYDRLARLAEWQHWTDDTPVPPTVFGPLWPEGPPAGWPADPELPQRSEIAFELAVQEGVSDKIIEDEVVNIFNAINRYYITRGGKPLDLEDFQPFVSALQLAEV